MNSERDNRRRSGARALPVVLGLVLVLGAATAFAEAKTGIGFVDPAPFDELAGEDDLVVYVSIGKTLLGIVASAFQGEDQELADAVTSPGWTRSTL
jgi:hypothetical protein